LSPVVKARCFGREIVLLSGMAEKIEMVGYWMGAPLNEVPREELEEALIDAHRQITLLNRQLCEVSVRHIRDLAAMGRQNLDGQKHRLLRWLGV
jgi:hypothetical protein